MFHPTLHSLRLGSHEILKQIDPFMEEGSSLSIPNVYHRLCSVSYCLETYDHDRRS